MTAISRGRSTSLNVPTDLSADEQAMWREQPTDCTPRSVLLRLSWERFAFNQARARIDALEAMLREAREWLDHDKGHVDCSACDVEARIDELLKVAWL